MTHLHLKYTITDKEDPDIAHLTSVLKKPRRRGQRDEEVKNINVLMRQFTRKGYPADVNVPDLLASYLAGVVYRGGVPTETPLTAELARSSPLALGA